MARRIEAFGRPYPFEFGPPESVKPAREFLGELPFAARRPAEARVEFERALRKTPNRTRAVLGLARADAALGDVQLAARHYARVGANWSKAEGGLRERAEVEQYLARAERRAR